MSIFSINDNSNYGSILSQSKANKVVILTLVLIMLLKQVLLIMIYQVNLKTLFIL